MHNFSNYNAFLRQVWSPQIGILITLAIFIIFLYNVLGQCGMKNFSFFFTSVFSSSNYFSSFFWRSFNCRKLFYVAGSTATYHSKTSQLKILPTRDCSESKQKITRFLSQVLTSFPSWHPISRNAPSFIPSNQTAAPAPGIVLHIQQCTILHLTPRDVGVFCCRVLRLTRQHVGVGKRGGGWAVHPTPQDVDTP